MSEARHVDLDALARERVPRGAIARPRRWLRVAVPLAILIAFGGVLLWSLGGALGGALRVRIVRPVPVSGEIAAHAAGQRVAQAAGWIEPDPFPIRVTALTTGIVREMLVQEADAVAAGEPIALLVDEDARLAAKRVQATCDAARAERAVAVAERDAAEESFEAALELIEREKLSRARLEGRIAESEHRAQAVVKGRALVAIAEEELAVQQSLADSGAAGPRQVELAAARVQEARGEHAILQADAALAASEVSAATAALERAERDLELRTEERLRVAATKARLALAEAACDEAEAMLAAARLGLERTTVRAPADGVVLERLASVGSVLDGDASTVATLYDPASLRVRVDVPQQDLAALFAGQAAEIESDARPGRPYRGEVIRVVRKADINKVTLQAHVRVLDGDELLRAEMLVQVRFLAPAAAGEEAGAAAPALSTARVAIPARLLVDGSRVWLVDGASGRAALRTVRIGARSGELAIVEEGLDLSAKLIDADPSELEVGRRVVAEEQR